VARYNADRNFGPILQAAREWAATCLVRDGSLLSRDGQLWTLENAEVLRRDFVERPNVGSGGFHEKLRDQLAASGAAATQLASEMVWAVLLFQSNVTARKKRENVTAIWEWSGEPAPGSEFLSEQVLAGIGSAGQGYNTYRWKELALLIDLTISIKKMTPAEREDLLADPWRFGQWLEQQPRDGYRQLPNLLRYLLFPDAFERISVAYHKRRILKELAPNLLPQDTESDIALDRALYELRSRITEERGSGNFDFYDEDLKQRWLDPATPAWLLSWNPRNWAWDTLAEDRERCARGERPRLGARLRTSTRTGRSRSSSTRATWSASVRRACSRHGPPTAWPTRKRTSTTTGRFTTTTTCASPRNFESGAPPSGSSATCASTWGT
jgi:5-methylcytosine-specific restriction protein B